jgi:hypothetical protein
MKKIIYTFSSLLFSALLISCKKDCSETNDVSKINLEPTFVHLEKEIDQVKSQQESIDFLKKNHLFTNFNLESGIPPQQLVQGIMWFGQDKKIDTLLLDVNKQFGDFKKQETELTDLFKNITFFYPNFKAPEVNTIVTGYADFVTEYNDSLLILGLEYFLDSTATYQTPAFGMPTQILPQYIKKRYQPSTIDIKSALAISSHYLSAQQEQKLISQMIKYGKQLYFIQKVLPCRSEQDILEYTLDEWAEIKSNEYTIYSYFAKNELFYDQKRESQRLFLDERPLCTEIGDKCPGRIGRWLGYEIVKAYCEKNDISLPQLMKENDHIKIFSQSAYKPEKK